MRAGCTTLRRRRVVGMGSRWAVSGRPSPAELPGPAVEVDRPASRSANTLAVNVDVRIVSSLPCQPVVSVPLPVALAHEAPPTATHNAQPEQVSQTDAGAFQRRRMNPPSRTRARVAR